MMENMDFASYHWEALLKMFAAFMFALPIAWEREHSTRVMGLRTFPLVSVACCGFVLVGHWVAQDSPDANARIIQGLMQGIGFLGGGAILKDPQHGVAGTATAASIWLIGAVGMATAHGYYIVAGLLAVANFLVLQFLTRFKVQDPLEKQFWSQDEEEEG